MDEGRNRVIGISLGLLKEGPRTDKLIAASVQWAEAIMKKIDDRFGRLKPH